MSSTRAEDGPQAAAHRRVDPPSRGRAGRRAPPGRGGKGAAPQGGARAPVGRVRIAHGPARVAPGLAAAPQARAPAQGDDAGLRPGPASRVRSKPNETKDAPLSNHADAGRRRKQRKRRGRWEPRLPPLAASLDGGPLSSKAEVAASASVDVPAMSGPAGRAVSAARENRADDDDVDVLALSDNLATMLHREEDDDDSVAPPADDPSVDGRVLQEGVPLDEFSIEEDVPRPSLSAHRGPAAPVLRAQ